MKRILTLACFLVVLAGASEAQSFITIPRANLSDIERQADAYYERLKRDNNIPDSIFNHEGGAYAHYQRFLKEWRPRLDARGNFDAYFENEKIYNDYFRKSNASYCDSGNDWWEIGPLEPPSGTMTANNGTHMGAGAVHFVKIHPNSNNIMLTGSNTGGLFYSTNAGVTWENSGSDTQWDKSGCSDAVFNENAPSKWFAISNGWNNPVIGWSGGVYRTTNSGGSWDKIGDGSNFGVWSKALKILISPGAGDEGVFCTTDGLFKSSNMNASNVNWGPWIDRKFPGKWVYDVALRPGTTSELYATVANSTVTVGQHDLGTDYEIWKSYDFGDNWTVVSGVPATFGPGIGLTIEFNEEQPDQFYVLNNRNFSSCLTVGYGTCANGDELWKHDINSNDWILLDSDFDISHGGGNGFGLAQTAGTERIYASHVDRYRIHENGVTTLFNASNQNKYEYHVDIEDFVGHPTNEDEVWMACHGGVFKSTDKGQSWIARSTGLGVAEPMGFATSYTSPDYILLGLYHDGSALTQNGYFNNWVPSWELRGTGDGMDALIDNLDDNYMYLSWQNGSWQRSTNTGASFSGIPGVGGNWHSQGILNKVVPATLYRATGEPTNAFPSPGAVTRSFNRGTNNATVSDFTSLLGTSVYNVAFLFNGHNEENYLYAKLLLGSGHGLVVNKDINNPDVATTINSWINLPLPSLNSGADFTFNDLFVDLDNPDIVYFAANSSIGSVGGQPTGSDMVIKADYTNPTSPVFTDLTYDLPNNRVGSLVMERGTNGGMYAATDWGVFYTNQHRISAGNQPIWCKFGPNLPHTEVMGLEINYQINKIRAALTGRGVWENDLVCPDHFDLVESGTYSADEYKEAENIIASTAAVVSPREVTYRAGYKIILRPGFRALNGSDFHAFIHPCNHGGNSFFKSEDESSSEEAVEVTLEPQEDARVYPNPNGGEFTLEISENIELGSLKVRIFDLSGKVVYQNEDVSSHKISIALAEVPRGLYLVQIASPKVQKTLRVVLE